MSGRIAGTCAVTADGETLELEGSLKIPLSAYKREEKVSATGRVYYEETPVAPKINGSFFVDKDFPLTKLTEATDMTIVASLANGMTYTLSGAFMSGDAEFDASAGTVDMTFTGDHGQWN